MVVNVQSDILIRLGDVNELRKQFGLQPFDETQHPKGSILMLKALNSDLMELEERKEKSIEIQVEIYNKTLTLSHRIQKPFTEIEDISEKILLNHELHNLQCSLIEFEDIYEIRIMEVERLKEESLKILKNLKNNANLPDNEMELLNKNYEEDETTVLSESLIENLRNINENLKEQYDLWMEQVTFHYDELIVKMEDISKKCFKPDGAYIYPLDFNQSTLDRLERDYQNMEEKYKRARPIFDKLNEWMTLWKEKLNAEKKACRTSFYNQRGGNLQASLKRQKTIAAKVPKCQQELQKIVEDYVNQHGDEDILIEGMLPDKYAEFLMKEYEHDREHGPFTSSPKQGRYGAMSTISGSSGYGGTSTSTGIPMSACKTPTSTKSRPWY